MSMVLGKFRNKKRLGKGAYGDVLLVEDPDGKQFAIKMISKKSISKQPYLQQYIEGQKNCMMSVKSKYIMELISVQEDDSYYYFICEYCDGGDLLNFQAKQEKKVFTLKFATKILSQVIHGLYLLHEMGYLHRDIKPQNILLKKDKDENNMYKLADFGFAKKNDDSPGTVLGTQHYMSPQIYRNDTYSYQVDMWAFGVLFYFMLNMEFPFRINPHQQPEQKRQQLLKQCHNFSYADSVKKSKKKLMENCNNQTEDLFKRIFDEDPERRITFAQIREHPLFAQYFPHGNEKSKILYGVGKKNKLPDKLQSYIIKNNQNKGQKVNVPASQIADEIDNVTPSYINKKVNTTQQKQIVEFQFERVDFLYQSEEQLVVHLDFIDPADLMAFRYNLLKYYVVLLREFIQQLTPQFYQKLYPNKNWSYFFKSADFNKLKRQYKQSLNRAELKVSQTYDQCKSCLIQIRKFNPKLELILEPDVSEKQLTGKFKESYRASTMSIYQKVREKFSNGNRFVYLTLLVIICHSFNHIAVSTPEQLNELFLQFVNTSKSKSKFMDFSQLKSWMTRSDKATLKNQILKIWNKYFG